MLPCSTPGSLEYLDASGRSPFAYWFNGLNAEAAAKVNTAITRLACGNLSNVKPAGSGVSERTIDFGPGYRIYFGQDGGDIIILLAGGTKRRQQDDIRTAISRWNDYKQRRRRL
jgi:putative addiction module killer protein